MVASGEVELELGLESVRRLQADDNSGECYLFMGISEVEAFELVDNSATTPGVQAFLGALIVSVTVAAYTTFIQESNKAKTVGLYFISIRQEEKRTG